MLPNFTSQTLDNGLKIYAIPVNIGSGVISVDLFYNVGSRDEKMGKSGIAHMLEHMNFKSTKTRKAGVFDEIVKGFGGVNNASTGFDYTHYYIKCGKANLDTSLELFADMMENLKLSDEEFQPERNVVLEERLWRTDNDPFGYLFFRLYNEAFIYHPYHWTPIGFKDDIKNWTIDDIKEFHDKFYQPKNAVLIVAGDIDENLIFDSAKHHFGNIENKTDLPKFHTFEPKQDGEKFSIVYKNCEVEIVAVAFKIPPFNHEDSVYLSALDDFLCGGKSSVFERILVDEKRLANQIYAYNMSSKDENLFIFFAVCNPNIKGENVKDEIFKILDDIKNCDLTQNDLEKIKNITKSNFIYSLDSASKVASAYGSYIIRGDLEALYKKEEAINFIDKEQIKRCLNIYFDKKNSTSLILRKENHG